MRKLFENLIQRLAVGRNLVPRTQVVERLDQQAELRSDTVLRRKRSSVKLLVAICCAVIPAGFIGIEIKRLVSPDDDLYSNGDFYNLTKENVLWDVYYGGAETCGKLDCHLTSNFPPSRFTKQMVLPAREFPLVGYRPGDLIYLRAKIKIPEKVLARNAAIAFHSLYVWAERYEVYVDEVLLDEGAAETLNVTIPRRMVPSTGEISVAVKIDPGRLPYQGIAHRKDLLIGDKQKLRLTSWRSVELTTTFWLWFLIPKLTFCFIFAILYIFLAQNRELFSFIIYILMSSFSIFIESAYADSIRAIGVNSALAAPLVLAVSDLFLILFFHDFYRRQSKAFFGLLRAALIGMPIVATIAVIALPGKSAVNTFLALELFFRAAAALYGIYCSLVTGLYLHRSGRSNPRKIIALILFLVMTVSLVPVTLETMRVVADILNMNFGGFPFIQAFDLVLFAVLASITAYEFGMTATLKQQIEKDLRIMEERLELGRSVQNLLLPAEREGESSGARYQFFLESAQTMAGDWFFVWEAKPGETRLFMGDVTGKGPQAALAVAAIISSLSGCQEENLSVEDAIDRLNRRIHGLFKGKVLTVMNVTVIQEGRRVDLYNCGSIGWVVRQGDRYLYVTAPGSQIGSSPGISIRKRSVALAPGETIVTFTDGILEGSRALKKLISGLSEAHGLKNGADHFAVAVEAGRDSVQADDRTLLFVQAA